MAAAAYICINSMAAYGESGGRRNGGYHYQQKASWRAAKRLVAAAINGGVIGCESVRLSAAAMQWRGGESSMAFINLGLKSSGVSIIGYNAMA